MTDQHPITPPPELVQQWREAPEFSALSPCVMVTVTTTKLQDIATQAARWGADQELDACCDWVSWWRCMVGGNRPEVGLRAFRRPKPPTLKEQALKALHTSVDLNEFPKQYDTIRRALEALPND